jgi:hypothetical protein
MIAPYRSEEGDKNIKASLLSSDYAVNNPEIIKSTTKYTKSTKNYSIIFFLLFVSFVVQFYFRNIKAISSRLVVTGQGGRLSKNSRP